MQVNVGGGILNFGPSSEKQQKLVTDILRFLKGSTGLHGSIVENGRLRVLQVADNKSIHLSIHDLEEVIDRSDVAGEDFIQVNFQNGQKILLTNTLIGFKPRSPKGLDSTRIPRVVTTPDVVNVFEAIQDAVHISGPHSHEVSLLKKVYEAVISGGEAVGFNLSEERAWLSRIFTTSTKLSS